MKRNIYRLMVGAWVLVWASLSYAGEGGHRFGAGVSFDRSIPILKLGDRYPASQQYGVVFDHRLSAKTTMELEYHHATLNDGKIERRSFVWPIDKQKYLSPDARSQMKLNSFLINALIRLGSQPSGSGLQLRPYVAFGAGFYSYRDRISGLIYPGQKVKPLNPGVLIEPREDSHASLGASLGLGMAVVEGHFGLDVRARCHMILGDLRPMEAWGMPSVFPMNLIDLRTTFKVYFR
ncbi:MAG: hypothetical protein A3F84_19270 [Candidatus Handelsmanbacteria bacterium RIFCSPLOWO2_12_FULL_64_10]|uniref:Outer membrane protein beta-barrel domain-containing protein n=1 Tax=Handelsmanbacteria sp. (strain RIFCSPLOWO2_12_FULL_64_10) TaxID=1817868 RepID=A0A1F6CZT3_HANXR|nr:MAG: hypothetical protein A3F84_19270 [Candidatus Handelsmanbacteria bacterium RIFCSPLOWO2_12_FULL_64_10]